MATRMNAEEAGQALVEVTLGLIVLCVFVLGIIDFGRAIYDVQVMKNLVGEGSSMASRSGGGTSLSNIAITIDSDAGNDLNMSTSGCVIVTQVQNMGSGSIQVLNQASAGGLSGATCKSGVGCVSGTTGCGTSNATLPTAAVTALTTEGTGSAIYTTEIYYNYSPITPIPTFLGKNVLPSQFYAVAYY